MLHLVREFDSNLPREHFLCSKQQAIEIEKQVYPTNLSDLEQRIQFLWDSVTSFVKQGSEQW